MSERHGFTLLLFAGARVGLSDVAQRVNQVKNAVALDNLERAAAVPLITRRILYTNQEELARRAPDGTEVILFPHDPSFHLGRHLLRLVKEHGLERVFYMSAGSAPLLTRRHMERMVEKAAQRENVFIANNFFSSDFLAFTPAGALEKIDLPRIDNTLAYLLFDQAHLEGIAMRPSHATMVDVDTPSDLMVLSFCRGLGERTRTALRAFSPPTEKLKAILEIMKDRDREIFIYGRVSSSLFTRLDNYTLCRLRLFSEERGMKSRGRLERMEVSSLLGCYIDDMGVRNFFRRLSSLCHGAIIDSRVLFAHNRRPVSQEDRFYSDLGEADRIGDPFVREFTAEAQRCEIPIVLGGHSLLSAGLWILPGSLGIYKFGRGPRTSAERAAVSPVRNPGIELPA